jgi:hypothetical protein
MNRHSETDQILRFDVPTLYAAARLAELLEDGWGASIHQHRGNYVVYATLDDDPEDLAVLLRIVENWVENESLWAIRYELDGKRYVLAAGEVAWAGLSAA